MRKWAKRIALFLGGLLLVLFVAVYFGGRYAAQKYLARDIKVGEGGLVRLLHPEFRWSLDLSADSILYTSPGLNATAGRTVVSANLFKSLLKFSPSVTLEVDTMALLIKPVVDTVAKKPKSDSAVVFPELKLPAAVVVKAGRLALFDTAGLVVQGDGVLLETPSKQAVKLDIRDVETRYLANMRQSLGVYLDWEDTGVVAADLKWRQAKDTLSLLARLSKADLRRGEASLKVAMVSSTPYRKALGLAPDLPRAENLNGDFKVALRNTLELKGALNATLDGFSDSAAYALGAQKASIHIDFKDTSGTWAVRSTGSLGEDVDLKGRLFLTETDSLGSPAYLAQVAGVTAQGHVKGIKVLAGEKLVRATVAVTDFQASAQGVRAHVTTGDRSFLKADLRREARAVDTTALVPPWQGAFSAEIKPGERWVNAFTDTNVSFKKFTVNGRMGEGTVSAVMEAMGLKAYGLLADSLRLRHRVAGQGYVLEPSHLYYRKVDWVLSGKADLAGAQRPLSFRMANGAHGSVAFSMPRAKVMEAKIDKLALEQLPYKGLDTLRANKPRLTADFAWNQSARSGHADVNVQGAYKNEKLVGEAHAVWTKALLEISKTRAGLAGSELKASAKLRLKGKQFYELGKLEREDYESVSLSSTGFDLSKAMRVAMPEPPLKSGVAVGNFGYTGGEGFKGTLRIQNLHMNEEEEKVGVKELALFGKGDSLILKVVTVSAAEPLFNDSITLAVSGILGRLQGLNLNAKMGPKIGVKFNATLTDFKDLKGKLAVSGDAVLPAESGELKGLKIRADIHLPFKDGIKGLRVEADTLRGDYVVAGLDTQAFSAPVKMQGGTVAIPAFSLKARSGAELKGKFLFNPAAKSFSGSLAGASFAAKIGEGDKVKLSDVNMEVTADSLTMVLKAAIRSGSAEHVKPPMRVAGDFSKVAVYYRAPMGKPDGVDGTRDKRLPFLRVSATLDSSELRYRLRSMETLQNLFKKTPERRAAKRSTPMQVQIDLETAGTGNSIETDILRMNYVGNFSMAGTMPYALVQGRVSSQKGELGAKKQSYAIKRMDLKWLNTPLAEGKVNLEAQKRLARDCEAGTLDSCNITTHLTGELADLKFTYDSDCQSAYGAGVEVAALIYSVRRGCYSSAFSAGGSGLSRQEQALGLLEPVASQYLSDAVGKLSGHWIASTQVSGLGALASDKKKSGAGVDSGSTAQEAIALEILSKEFWRTRVRLKSAYAPENAEADNPWNYRAALEWRPPVPPFIESEKWRNRVRNNVNIEAAVYTNPDRTQEEEKGGGVLKRLGLNYIYGFWGTLWAKKGSFPQPAKTDSAAASKDAGKVATPGTME
jgi:hypothetical protein